MAWVKLDFLRHEASFFSSDCDDLICAVYKAAFTTLDEVHRQHQKLIDEQWGAAADPESREESRQYRDYEEERFQQQMYALTTMTLALIAARIESLIDEAKDYFRKTHPPTKNKYDGDSKLQRRIAEYRERFQLNMEELHHFASVREVILARNCCIHKGGEPDEAYKTQTRQRLVDKWGRICISMEQLACFNKELKEFAEELTDQLCRFRDAARQAVPTSLKPKQDSP